MELTNKRIEKLGPEQEALLPVYRDKWLKIGLSTERADRPMAEEGVRMAYQAAGLTPPKVIVWFESPMAGAMATVLLGRLGSLLEKGFDLDSQTVREALWQAASNSVMSRVSEWASKQTSLGLRAEGHVAAVTDRWVIARKIRDMISGRDPVDGEVDLNQWKKAEDEVGGAVGDWARVYELVQDLVREAMPRFGLVVEQGVRADIAQHDVRAQAIKQVTETGDQEPGDQVFHQLKVLIDNEVRLIWLSIYNSLNQLTDVEKQEIGRGARAVSVTTTTEQALTLHLYNAIFAAILNRVWFEVEATLKGNDHSDQVMVATKVGVFDDLDTADHEIAYPTWQYVWEQLGKSVMAQIDHPLTDLIEPTEQQVPQYKHLAELLQQVVDQVKDQVLKAIEHVKPIGSQTGSLTTDVTSRSVRDLVTNINSNMDEVGTAWSGIWNTIWDSLWNQLKGDLNRMTSADMTWQRAVYGQHDAGWLSFYDFFGEVYQLEACLRLKGLITVAQSAGWWWPMRNIAIVTERPTALHRDAQNRLHNATGPAIVYPDGWGVWAWHGLRVPKDMIEGRWSTDQILAEPNAEIRRAAIEHMGWEQFVLAARLTQVGETVPDPGNPGHSLSLYDVPRQIYDTDIRVLICDNATPERDGTRRRFGLTVPVTAADPVTAAAWTFGLTKKQYLTMQRST